MLKKLDIAIYFHHQNNSKSLNFIRDAFKKTNKWNIGHPWSNYVNQAQFPFPNHLSPLYNPPPKSSYTIIITSYRISVNIPVSIDQSGQVVQYNLTLAYLASLVNKRRWCHCGQQQWQRKIDCNTIKLWYRWTRHRIIWYTILYFIVFQKKNVRKDWPGGQNET